MLLYDEIGQRRKPERRRQRKLHLREVRPSILDPCLECEPWIGQCPCSETLVLFMHNHPIALIPGTSLEYSALNMRLYQLRHRWPRQA